MGTWEEYLPSILSGLVVTLGVSGLAILLMLPVAFLLGTMRTFDNRFSRGISLTVLDFFRGGSGLVYLFWAFYVLPLMGVTLSPFFAGVLVIGLVEGAYGSEIVRSGLQSVPPTQREAARTLGLSRPVIYFRIVLPQALQVMILPFGNLMITLIKYTAVLSLVTVNDLTAVARKINFVEGNSVLIYGGALVVYYLLALVISALTKYVDRVVSVEARLRKRANRFMKKSSMITPVAAG